MTIGDNAIIEKEAAFGDNSVIATKSRFIFGVKLEAGTSIRENNFVIPHYSTSFLLEQLRVLPKNIL